MKAINGLLLGNHKQQLSEMCICNYLHKWCENTGSIN